MKIGVCTGCTSFDRIEIVAKVGFDYLEIGFADMARRSDEEFDAFLDKIQSLNLKCEAANSFVPSDIKLTGEDVDYDLITDFLEKGMERAGRIGIKTVVFGSSKARNLPEGFSSEEGYKQLVKFLKEYAGPIAKKYNIDITVEPLNRKETNLIFTVEDGVMLARASGQDNVKGLADLYHMHYNQDDVENIKKFKDEVAHAHIACGATRHYPKADDGFDYKPFIDALKFANCQRISVEGRSDDFETDAPLAFELLKSLI